MSVINPLFHQLDAEVHWMSRSDFAPMLSTHPRLSHIWSYDKKTGLLGLWRMVRELKKEGFDYVYDAHQNIRSFIVRTLLGLPRIHPKYRFAVRRKKRIRRFFFFQLCVKNALPYPYRAVVSFLKPLRRWGIDISRTYDTDWQFGPDVVKHGDELTEGVFKHSKVVTIVPSAAWELKRWPVSYWQDLVSGMPDHRFVILAGPTDHFTEDIYKVAPDRVLNLAGKTNLQESFYIISRSKVVVSADTGFLHAADLFKRKGIALMGPTAFGYPTGNTIKVLEIDGLKCRPCTKAGNTTCKLPNEYRACLLDTKPQKVMETISTLEKND